MYAAPVMLGLVLQLLVFAEGRSQDWLQLAAFVEFMKDIAASDEFAIDENLRNGGPSRVLLNSVTHQRIG